MRVLVIDDAFGMRESLKVALTEAGHDVEVVADGQAGLEQLGQKTFDALVTDIWMPNVDGLSVIKRVRLEQPNLRVFAMTGGGPSLTIEAAGSLASVWGAERVFVKPFDEALLVQALGVTPVGFSKA
jgi:two-component system chemotaxis response regulator CheY